MKVKFSETPREFDFNCPCNHNHVQRDYGEIQLDADDLISFVTSSGKKSDVVGKSWGLFVTQSTNSRLKKQGLRTAIIMDGWRREYVVVVDDEEGFWKYLKDEGYDLMMWLDEVKPEK